MELDKISPGEFKLNSDTSAAKETIHANSLSDYRGSYVLLAACGRNASAFERGGRGRFTQALMTILHSAETDEVTYVDLMTNLSTSELVEGLRISLISCPPRH